MSRAGYSDDLDQADLARWRGAVESAIRGKRGQAFLKELEAALVALPEKWLIGDVFATEGNVCALGTVSLSRGIAAGATRAEALAQIMEVWPTDPDEYDECGDDAALEFNIAQAMAREIMFVNDECHGSNGGERYTEVLAWVRSKIKKPEETK